MAVTLRKKNKAGWKNPIVAHEYSDGWSIIYLDTEDDLKLLGRLMGHCSGRYRVWACEEKIWYFFVLIDPEGIPHVTIHAKVASWMNKEHPREKKRDPYAYPNELGTSSCAYDCGANNDYGSEGFDTRFGNHLVNRGTKIDVVEDSTWDEYVRCYKALKDEYDKKIGALKVAGRRFKYDGKWLILLSCGVRGQGTTYGTHRQRVHEWLVECNKKGT